MIGPVSIPCRMGRHMDCPGGLVFQTRDSPESRVVHEALSGCACGCGCRERAAVRRW